MKLFPYLPQDEVFWYLNESAIKPLTHDIKTDVVIIGGGMAGLSAAQKFLEKNVKVVLIEKNYCGSGATGKSSGFTWTGITTVSLHKSPSEIIVTMYEPVSGYV